MLFIKLFEAIIIPLNILINSGKQQEKPGEISNNKLKLLFLKKYLKYSHLESIIKSTLATLLLYVTKKS